MGLGGSEPPPQGPNARRSQLALRTAKTMPAPISTMPTRWNQRITATWKPLEEVTLFGGWSRGFRSGGFNQTGVGAVAAGNGFVGVSDIFEAEIAETFEVGAKTQTSDRMLTFNVSAYITKSENSYFFVFLAANSTQNLGNVPEARLKGFEIDATLRAAPGLDFILGYGYTDSAIRRFPTAALIGNRLPGVRPHWRTVSGWWRLIGVALARRRRRPMLGPSPMTCCASPMRWGWSGFICWA